MIATPAVRPFSSSVTVWTGAISTICSASSVETVFPSARFVCRPTVPVTTIRSSSMALSSSAIRRSVVPTVASSDAVRCPIIDTRSVTACPLTLLIRKRPSLFVRAPRFVPTTITLAPGSGCPVSLETTVPPMAPCAATGAAARRSRSANEPASTPRSVRGGLLSAWTSFMKPPRMERSTRPGSLWEPGAGGMGDPA